MCNRALVKKEMVHEKINDKTVRKKAYPTMFHLLKIGKLYKLWSEGGEYFEILRVLVKGYTRRCLSNLMRIVVRLANTMKRKIANQLLSDEDVNVPSDCDDEVCTAICCIGVRRSLFRIIVYILCAGWQVAVGVAR